LRDEFNFANLLVGRHASGDKIHDFLARSILPGYHKRLRHFARLVVATGNDSGIGDGRMSQQDSFKFRRSHLKALVFN
jgi:hypothetical protein